LRCGVSQVFSEIRNEHFSNVFGFLSQKARNLQTAYDVSKCPQSSSFTVMKVSDMANSFFLTVQKRRGMDIKQMKTFVSEELKGLKQEHRLLSLREGYWVNQT